MTGRAWCFILILSIGLLWGQSQYPEVPELIQAGKLQEAQAVVDKGLARTPNQPELMYWQAVLHLKQNRVDQAETLLSRLKSEGRALPPHLILLGQIYESREQWAQAAETYRKLTTVGRFPRARLGLGLAEFKLGNYETAIKSLGPMAIEGAPAEVFHLLGLAYLGKGELETAARHLGRAAALDGDNASYHYDLGLALLEGHQLEAAAREFKRAVQLDPQWPQAYLYLGRALHDLNRGDDALKAFQEAARLDPDLPLLEYHLGLLQKGRGNFDAAVQHFEKELARGNHYPACYYHLAELTSRRGEEARGRELAEAAVRLEPKNVEYRLLAARLALENGDPTTAGKHLQAALSQDPESGPAYYLQGRLLQAQGKRDEAARAFAQARKFSDLKSRRTGQP